MRSRLGKGYIACCQFTHLMRRRITTKAFVLAALMLLVGAVALPVVSTPSLATVTFYTHAGGNSSQDGDPCSTTSTSFKTIRGGIKWNNFPVDYYINASNAGTDQTQAYAAVVAGFNTWDAEDHGGDENLVFFHELLTENGAEITVSWASMDGPGGTLASALISFNPATKTINSVTITFDSLDTWKVFGSLECGEQTSGTPDVDEFDIEDVAAHEIGHAVGLDHVKGGEDTYNTLYTYVLWEGETHKRTLGDGDRAGMVDLYGDAGGDDDDNGNGPGGGSCPPRNPNCP